MARIFLGIPLSKELQYEVEAWQAEHNILPVRWTEREDLHVTLHPPFPGTADEVIRRAGAATGLVKPFDIEFEGVSFGPNPHSPRLIWAYGMPPTEILDLKSELEDIFTEIPRQKRDFTLHATIGRFQEEDFKSFPVKQLNEPVSFKMRVDSFAVFESLAGPGGAEYKIHAEIPLA